MSAGGAAYTPAFTNLDARSAGDLQAALAGAGIAAKLADGGTDACWCRRSKVNEARVAAGKAGVGGDRADWSLLDKSSLSQTDGQCADEGAARALRACSRRRSRTIAGVCRATVNLAHPRAQRVQRRPGAAARLRRRSTACGGIADRHGRARHRRARRERRPRPHPAEHLRHRPARPAPVEPDVGDRPRDGRRDGGRARLGERDRPRSRRPRSTRWSASAPARRSSPAS